MLLKPLAALLVACTACSGGAALKNVEVKTAEEPTRVPVAERLYTEENRADSRDYTYRVVDENGNTVGSQEKPEQLPATRVPSPRRAKRLAEQNDTDRLREVNPDTVNRNTTQTRNANDAQKGSTVQDRRARTTLTDTDTAVQQYFDAHAELKQRYARMYELETALQAVYRDNRDMIIEYQALRRSYERSVRRAVERYADSFIQDSQTGEQKQAAVDGNNPNRTNGNTTNANTVEGRANGNTKIMPAPRENINIIPPPRQNANTSTATVR